MHDAATTWTGVMEHRPRDTKTTLDHFKLLTSTQNTALHTVWLRFTAVRQRAVAVPEGAAAPCIEWLMLATILKIADAMVDNQIVDFDCAYAYVWLIKIILLY